MRDMKPKIVQSVKVSSPRNAKFVMGDDKNIYVESKNVISNGSKFSIIIERI